MKRSEIGGKKRDWTRFRSQSPSSDPSHCDPNGFGSARQFSEKTAEAIDAEMIKIIGESHEEAKRLLTAYRKQLDALAEALVARETLNEQEILEVTGLPRAPALETGMLPGHGTDGENGNASREASASRIPKA